MYHNYFSVLGGYFQPLVITFSLNALIQSSLVVVQTLVIVAG